MAKKVLRQGLRVSIKELRDLADEMLKEGLETNAEIGISDPKILEKGWIIAIVNKQPQCSDTWEIEKGRNTRMVSKKTINKKALILLKKIRKAKRKPTMKEIEEVIKEVRERENKPNKRFFESMQRMGSRKKKITPEQVSDLIQKVRYGEKKRKRK